MSIITLTTDFGHKDYYVAQLKGAILSQTPNSNIVDITHEVSHHNIVQAAYIIKNAYATFPTGTIHIVGVNNYYATDSTFLVTNQDNHFFIAPDNGLLSLMFEQLTNRVYRIQIQGNEKFLIKNIIATIVRHIIEGGHLADIGQRTTSMDRRIALKPVISPSRIRGSVIHIDHYENVIINITQTLFNRVGNGRPFRLFFKRFDPITVLSKHYQDVNIGEILCWFNSSDNLEIAINMGKAASMLGLNLDDTIEIDFKLIPDFNTN